VHLDSVDGLGEFLELEVVLQPGQTAADGEAIAARLMEWLGIREADLCSGAYADMGDRTASPPAAASSFVSR
jgi:adenylate cyclase class IV